MRVLITGGAGFIGSNLVRRIYEKTDWDIDIVDYASKINEDGKLIQSAICPFELWSFLNKASSNRLTFYQEDFGHDKILQKVERGQYGAIFHLAAEPSVQASFDFPEYTINNNVVKTVKLISAVCRSKNPASTKFIFSSSCAVYGSLFVPNDGLSEYLGKSPISPYALQKSYIEDYLDMMSSKHGITAVSLRYFNVYGPGQLANSAYSSVMTAWASASLNNLPLQVHGDGMQTRDMVYVSDVCDANIMAASYSGSNIFNVGTGTGLKTSDILNYFQNYFPNISIVEKPAREGDIRHSRANIDSITCMGWSPKVSFSEGFEKTIKWWLKK